MAKKMNPEMFKKHAANKKAFQKIQKKSKGPASPLAPAGDDEMGEGEMPTPKMPMMFPKKK